LKEKLPKSKILFLATFPSRDGGSGKRRSAACLKASGMVEKLADNKTLFYMDIGPKFLNADGGIDKEVFYDGCHPATKGYEIWAEAIEPTVAELLGEKAGK
jgi:lysophospholipase L1-like esterase